MKMWVIFMTIKMKLMGNIECCFLVIILTMNNLINDRRKQDSCRVREVFFFYNEI